MNNYDELLNFVETYAVRTMKDVSGPERDQLNQQQQKQQKKQQTSQHQTEETLLKM